MAGMIFEITGIGDLIRKGRLIVPANQRSYAWEEQHVRELLQDVAGEMNKEPSKGPPEYFLGTVVLVKPDESGPPQISDGQQRCNNYCSAGAHPGHFERDRSGRPS
jgi:uncharacterized protein with ParB-like and HNH nuclease domain